MTNQGRCGQCGGAISYETGFTFAHDGLFCPTCRPVKDGYTISDLQRWGTEVREGWQKIIRDRELRHMDQLGPDVYFHALGNGHPADNEIGPPGG